VHAVTIGNANVQAVQLNRMIQCVLGLIKEDPFALLCGRPECARCSQVRKEVRRMA